jgi:TolB-like protein
VILGLVALHIAGGSDQLKAGDIKSLAILPFDNFTGDDQLDYVAAGMHSSLIGDMGKVGGLRVIGKTTSSMYKNAGMSAPEIARELDVEALVEPTVTCYGDTVCVQIRLITTYPEDRQFWVGEYMEDKSQIMSLYNRITQQIADEVKVHLTPEQEQMLTESRTVNSEAYDCYLKGLYYWDQFTPEALQLALEYFNKAIETDPGWAEPYAGVAYFWVAIHQFSLAPSAVTVPNMYQNLNKAIELDPQSGFVHYVNGLVSVWTGFEWEKGEQEFLKSLETNPNYALGHMYYAHLLAIQRSIDESLSHCRTALDLDPLNPMIQSLSSLVLSNAGEYEESVAMCRKVLAVIPGLSVALGNLTGTYAILGEYRKSLENWTHYVGLEDQVTAVILELYDKQGFDAALKLFISELDQSGISQMQMDFGQLYALAGDESNAMYWYHKAYEERNPMIPYITTVYHDGGPFKIESPEFDSLLVKLNLPL